MHTEREREIDVYLATPHTTYAKASGRLENDGIYILESFFYVKPWMYDYIQNKWNFLLDSGAFTFFGKKKSVNWVEYLESYAKFINKHDIKLFFELDIDIVVGIEQVEKLRELLVSLTGKQPIPVWRPSRGIQYWHDMIAAYPYIAISVSGMFDSGWSRKQGSEHVLKQMVDLAHAGGTKVHGLGYTKMDHLAYIGWDSIDSTAWIYGNISGLIYEFKNGSIITHRKPKGTMMATRQTAIHNFNEWVKFQRYALEYL